jgi:putative glutamine amidotransferase
MDDTMTQTHKPIIGITMDHEVEPTYSKFPWYALRDNYAGSVAESGGIPFPLAHEIALAETYLSMIDGLIITGGAFDVSPELYGETLKSDKVSLKDRRTRFEYAMTEGAISRNMPIFGICGGEQLLNVVCGGTLIQHIPDVVTSTIAHEQPNPRNEASHSVTIMAGSKLAAITGKKSAMVNSAHHQAVDKIGRDMMVSAIAPDGVIEAIELTNHPFCIGVQWHPEFFITEADNALYDAFIEASIVYKAAKNPA